MRNTESTEHKASTEDTDMIYTHRKNREAFSEFSEDLILCIQCRGRRLQ